MDEKLLPKWIFSRYLKLWTKYDSKGFTFEESQQTLKEDGRLVAVVLSELNKYKWLETEQNKGNPRKKIYRLKSHSIIHDKIGKELLRGVKE